MRNNQNFLINEEERTTLISDSVSNFLTSVGFSEMMDRVSEQLAAFDLTEKTSVCPNEVFGAVNKKQGILWVIDLLKNLSEVDS